VPADAWVSVLGRRVVGVGGDDGSYAGAKAPQAPTARRAGLSRGERLFCGEHVPDRLGEFAREVCLGDLGSALAAQAALGVLVVLGVDWKRRRGSPGTRRVHATDHRGR